MPSAALPPPATPPFCRRRRGERGVVAVMSAFVLPLLTYFMLAMFESGFQMIHDMETQNAANAVAVRNSLPSVVQAGPYPQLDGISGRNFIKATAQPTVDWHNQYHTARATGTVGEDRFALGSLATMYNSRYTRVTVNMPHYKVTPGALWSSRVSGQTSQSSALTSQLVWDKLTPIPARVILVLDWSSSMQLAMRDEDALRGGPAHLQMLYFVRQLLGNDASDAGQINWGWLPFADNFQVLQDNFTEPLDCRFAQVGQDAFDPDKMKAHRKQVLDEINAFEAKYPEGYFGQRTDMAAALKLLGGTTKFAQEKELGCGPITYVIVSDGAPTTYGTQNGGSGPAVTSEDTKDTARQQTVDALTAALGKEQPHKIMTFKINTHDTADAANEDFMESIACESPFTTNGKCNNRSDLYANVSSRGEIEAVLKGKMFDFPSQCIGFNLKVPTRSWALPLPKRIDFPKIWASAFFWSPSLFQDGETDTELLLKARRPMVSDLDQDPTRPTRPNPNYYSFTMDSEFSPPYLMTNSQICGKAMAAKKAKYDMTLRLRWGHPVIANYDPYQ